MAKRQSFKKTLFWVLTLSLLVQGFAIGVPGYAQQRGDSSAGKGIRLPPTPGLRPTLQPLTDLGEVNMEELAGNEKFAPSISRNTQIKPIHLPNNRPSDLRGAVEIGPEARAAATRRGPLSAIPTVPSPRVTRTFKSDNLSIGFIPPDTMGAVGLNHVVTTTNEKVIVHDRNGVFLSIVTLDSFWAVLPNGLADPATFDPKILYDRFNDRFIFCVTANAFDPTSATLFAVSQTGNPLGAWNRYAIDADAAATDEGGDWADYPSIGFNNKWITISINRFGFGNESGYQGPSIYVINKALAYSGSPAEVSVFKAEFQSGCLDLPTAAAQNVALGCGFTYVPAITETNAGTDHYIVEDWDSTAGQLRMTRVTGPTEGPTLVVGYQFPQSPYSWRFNSSLISGSGGYLPQRQQNIYLPSGTRPTANDSRIQNAVLRNGTFWTTHAVFIARTLTAAGTGFGASNPDVRAVVQWWQINPLLTDSATGTAPIQREYIQDPRADNCHNGAGGTRAGCTTLREKPPPNFGSYT